MAGHSTLGRVAVMTTEIATNKSFQERMFDKIRDQMGELLTDAELKSLVDQAVQKAFFEERKTRSGYHDEIKPALFVEMMQTELKQRVGKALEAWISANQDVVTDVVDKVIKDGITKAVMQTLEWRMNWPLQNFAEQLKSKGVFL